MSQHDYVIDNQTFPATRTDINNALAAIVTSNAGATAPSTTYAYQLWYDTTNDILKMRNSDDDAWIDLFDINQTTDAASAKLGADVTISGDLTVDTNTLYVDSTNNYVGVGTTSPATATGGGIDIEKAGGASVRLDDTTNTVTGELQVYSSGMNLATTTNHNIIISPNNSEVARFTANGLTMVSGKGIDFSATSNGVGTTSSEIFDDYEEGLWTPTISIGVSSITYSNQFGYYTKIGDRVIADFWLRISGTGAGTRIRIAGLPFSLPSGNATGSGLASYQNLTGYAVHFYGISSTTSFEGYQQGASNFSVTGSITNLYIIGSFNYKV